MQTIKDLIKESNQTFEYIPIYSTEDQVQMSYSFADKCYEKRKDEYARRQQSSRENIVKQIGTSKIFEFMVYNFFNEYYSKDFVITPPSVEVYSGYARFDDDLRISKKIDNKGIGVHIKSQELSRINSNYPISWAFQKNDPIFKDKGNDLMVLGIFFEDSQGGLLSKNPVNVFEKHLGEPKKSSLSSKLFIYYDINKECFKLNA